ncbi:MULTISPECIES: CPBP family intramembrane glutamic endopeptidase [Catenuloplanes]|uniref:Membrane protease YdiL (CAAX protease family) n=1 Tax=Catenuloplanes niger TaxID=587534 RepID=A0AAE4CSP0_9ACTN|nr:type II CAAX endopeptidase family protein [Catenuloplanes niger]MDR7319949.1 membrane protease YdiL (CAAX protease family) [Catenuloplanes niger]
MTPRSPALDPARPFGAHLRMSWWKALVVIAVPPLVMVILQVVLYLAVGVVEGGDDPLAPTFTPLKLLAVNLSIVAAGVLAVLLLARLTRTPWRRLLSHPRGFDRRRLARYLLGAAVLVGAGIAVVALVAPEAPGWTGFAVTGTSLGMVAVTLLSTPLQSAGEELMFRGAVLPAAASWLRAVRPALVLGIVVSGAGFALIHGSGDPWLFGYYTFLGVCTGVMAARSRGLEAPIAFHVANNVLFSVVNSLMAGGEGYTIDRSSDTGDASLLILAVVNVAMVALVWMNERGTADPAVEPER